MSATGAGRFSRFNFNRWYLEGTQTSHIELEGFGTMEKMHIAETAKAVLKSGVFWQSYEAHFSKNKSTDLYKKCFEASLSALADAQVGILKTCINKVDDVNTSHSVMFHTSHAVQTHTSINTYMSQNTSTYTSGSSGVESDISAVFAAAFRDAFEVSFHE